jgi:cell division protein FtsA
MKEIFTLINRELESHKLKELVPAGLVLTGGGAETVGIVEVAKRVMNLPVRVGKPTQIDGLVNDIQKPSFATSIGLLTYGRKQGGTHPARSSIQFGSFFKNIQVGSLGQKILQLIKSVMP